MILLNLFLIQIIAILIIDISGFVQEVLRGISKILTKGKIISDNYDLKPFTCSLCSGFWTNLIYILCTGNFSIPIFAFILFIAVLSPVLKDSIILVKDIFIFLINKIYDLLQ